MLRTGSAALVMAAVLVGVVAWPAAADTQFRGGVTWALDRIDQRALPLDQTYEFDSETNGSGVTVYVLDTGIRASHEEFGGRVVKGYTVDTGQEDSDEKTGSADCNGHGTAVASLVGGEKVGVAPGVRLVPVHASKGCTDNMSPDSMAAGVEWIITDAKRPENANRRAVINISAGNPAFDIVKPDASGKMTTTVGKNESAVEKAVEAGITVVVGAGNDGQDACEEAPGRSPRVITVGATAKDDSRASYSNYGKCVSIFAPGNEVWVASHKADETRVIKSGTSFAAPLVAGAAARYLQANPAATPAEVKKALIDNSSTGVITDPGKDSPNRLLHVPPAGWARDTTPAALPKKPKQAPPTFEWAETGAPPAALPKKSKPVPLTYEWADKDVPPPTLPKKSKQAPLTFEWAE